MPTPGSSSPPIPSKCVCLGWPILLLTLLCWAIPAHAEPIRATLVLNVGDNTNACPAQTELESRVHAELGYTVFVGGALTFDVQVARTTTGFDARLVSREGDTDLGERILTSESCPALFNVVAMAIALAIDPLLGARQVVDAPASPAPSDTTLRPSAPSAPSAPTPSSNPWRLRVGVAARASLGIAPEPSFGGRAVFAARQHSFSLGVETAFELGPPASIGEGKVQTSLLLGGVSACGHHSWFSLCGVFLVGAFQAEGSGFARTLRSGSVYASAGFRAAGEWTLSDAVFAFATLDAVLNLLQSELRISGEPAWRMPFVAATLSLGIGFETAL